MSCQFKTVANIVNVDRVKQCLFEAYKEKSDETSNKADPWDWNLKDDDSETRPATDKDDNWLNGCHVALSPTGELLVLAYKHSMVFLASKWDSLEESAAKTKYHIVWSGKPHWKAGEEITAVVCLPLAASQSRSAAHCGPDWTCVAVGFSSGAIRFYTEKGALLFSDVLHEEPITGLKCQSYQPARLAAGSEQNEELHILYRSTICCVFGFALCNTLRACRNQLARVQANCSHPDTVFAAPPLSSRKFSIPEQGSISDSCVGPIQCPPGFTHLVTASICGGFNAWYRPSPPQSSLVLAVGTKPFVGFHSAIEGSSAPVLTDVAKAMATKLKSAIGQAVPGWLLGGKKTTAQQEKLKDKQVLEPAEPMTCRFGLCDLWRQGEHIVMSPNRKLSVVSDTLGRVVLVDNLSGIAVRMWKGYRDAECGWVMCSEEKKGSGKRSASFLIIYSPRKGILEVWAMQQGPRVATFPVSKTGRLLYVGYSLLGVGGLSSKEKARPSSPCIFIDHTGALKEITVPFHCALSDKNSKRARDVLLLKKLKSTMREEDGMSEVGAICKELQTNEMRMQSLDLLCSNNYITADTLSDVLSIFTQVLPMPVVNAASSQTQEEENVNPGGKVLMEKIQLLEQLITFYQFLAKLRQKPPDYDTIVPDSTSDYKQELCKLIQATPEEIDKMLMLLKSGNEASRVKFEDNTRNLSTFLLGFQGAGSEMLELSKSISSDKLLAISEQVCQGCLDGNCSMDEWQNAACESRVSPTDLMSIALNFWLNKKTESTVVREMIRFSQLIKAICLIAGKSSQDSVWWSQVRATLRDSENPLSALSAALICRSVGKSMEDILSESGEGYDEEGNKEGMTTSTEMEWENVSQESCQWSQLISQLEDIAFLHSILSCKVGELDAVPHSSRLKYEKPNISLGLVLSKGKGCIPEMVAKRISCSGLDPTLLLETASLAMPGTSVGSVKREQSVTSLGVAEGVAETVENSIEAQPTNDKQNVILEELLKLRQHFPYSLASNSLLANLCWEYVLAWNRDVDSLTNLVSAINCLKVILDPHLRQGLCTMIWSMHLKLRFEAALRLINKVGKVAKERLCRQDVGLSDFQMADFFSFCSDFIDVFMESNVVSEATEKSVQRSETLWECCAPVPSLTQLALGQPVANYDLLQLLSQVTRAMLLLATFNLRTHRPLAAFFDTNGQAGLFCDIWSKPQLPGHSHDPKLTESRTKFLLRAVSAAMGTIISHQQQEWDAKQAIHWMSECLSLSADWSIPVDPLRRQQACQLYARGFDRLAEEVIPAVNDSSLLGSQLLVIAGQRLNKTLMSSNKDLKERITNLSPSLSKWINELGEGSIENSPISETSQLSKVVLGLLPDDHPDRNLARQLADSLQHLAASDSCNK